jgi:hypothetical protein
MDNESRNRIYSNLTRRDSEESTTLNFFESLRYRENGQKIVDVLSELDESDYTILSSFISTKLVENNSLSEFKHCQIKVEEDKFDKVLKIIKNHEHTDEVLVFEDFAIGFFIKE